MKKAIPYLPLKHLNGKTRALMFQNRRMLVCDLDNTLYDWVGYFVTSFYAMVDVVQQLTGWNREALLDDFRRVHQRHADSEHPFALLETDHVAREFANRPIGEVVKYFDPAFHAFNSSRKRSLKLYPRVAETMIALEKSGLIIVAHTESKTYSVVDRVTRLDLAKHFSAIFCRQRSESRHPKYGSTVNIPAAVAEKIHELSHHQRKPDKSVLLEICKKMQVEPSEAVYVGDSIARDVLMAKRAGVYAAWAAYGSRHDHDQYERLVRISHWTPEDVHRERELSKEAASTEPNFVAERGFYELLETP